MNSTTPTSRPPACVALVARTHGLVGITALASLVLLHLLTRNLRQFDFGPSTYTLGLAIGITYCLTAVLVWFGTPVGRLLSRICGLLYLTRPQLGSHLWRIMDSADYQAHFRRPRAP